MLRHWSSSKENWSSQQVRRHWESHRLASVLWSRRLIAWLNENWKSTRTSTEGNVSVIANSRKSTVPTCSRTPTCRLKWWTNCSIESSHQMIATQWSMKAKITALRWSQTALWFSASHARMPTHRPSLQWPSMMLIRNYRGVRLLMVTRTMAVLSLGRVATLKPTLSIRI